MLENTSLGCRSEWRRTLRLTDPGNPDQYIGYEKDMVDALANAMGRKAEFVPSDWETLVSALQRKSFDVLVNGLEPTGDRAQQIAFSNPYYIFQLQLTVRRDDNRIHSIDDCKDKVVGTLGNTAASRLLQQRNIPYRGYQDPSALTRLGTQADRCGRDGRPAGAFYARQRQVKASWSPFSRSAYVMACAKVTILKAEVDTAIEKNNH